VQNTFEPDAVRRVLLHYRKNGSSHSSICSTVELFDKNDKLIKQCGKPQLDYARERHEIRLDENERLVGVVCSTHESKSGCYYTSDLQFIIGKKHF
jgi:hypothetical protein